MSIVNDELHEIERRRGDGWASVRTVIQGLVLAGILSLVGLVIKQGRDQSEADSARRVQIATLQTQVANLQISLAGVADMKQRITMLETNQKELLRRQSGDEAWRDKWQDNWRMKGWSR